MTASVWVYISTIVFVGIVFYLAKKPVISYLQDKQDEISDLLKDIEAKNLEAKKLYDKYRKKMDSLDSETSNIISSAEETAKGIISQAEKDIENIKNIKKNELDRRLKEYEESLKQKLYDQYSSIIIDRISSSARSNIDNSNLDFSSFKL